METHRNPCSVTLTTQIAVSFCIPACKRGESTCDVMASTKVFTVPHSAILVAKLTGKLQSVSARLDFILILLYVYVYKYVYIYIYVYTALYNDVCINILYRYRYRYRYIYIYVQHGFVLRCASSAQESLSETQGFRNQRVFEEFSKSTSLARSLRWNSSFCIVWICVAQACTCAPSVSSLWSLLSSYLCHCVSIHLLLVLLREVSKRTGSIGLSNVSQSMSMFKQFSGNCMQTCVFSVI